MPSTQAASADESVAISRSAAWATTATLLLLIAAGTAVRLVSLALKPFWFDECFSAVIARISWPSFLHLLWWREANMSLYYLLLRLWLHWGESESFIRGLSVAISAATIPAIYWLARLLYDRRTALIAAALLTFNAYSVRYAQEARSYSLFLLLATLSSALLIAFLKRPEPRKRRLYIALSILAVYAHLYALLLIMVHWLALRWFRRPEEGSNPAALLSAGKRSAGMAIGLAVLPLLIFVAKTGAGPIRWIPRPGIHELIQFVENLAGSNRWPLPAIYFLACLAAVAGGGRVWQRSQPWAAWRVQFLLLWLLFPATLTVALSFVRPVFLARYMIFCLPALMILAAAGLARLRSAWLLAGTLAAILLLCSQGILFVYGHDFDNERDASAAATDFILDRVQPGDGIVFHIAATRATYEFFRSIHNRENPANLGPEVLFPSHGATLDYRDFTGKPTEELLRSTASHPRLWVMLMYNERAETVDPSTGMMDRVLPQIFVGVRRWQFARVEVRLYTK